MTKTHTNITVYHIPICPFSQRLEILLTLKGRQNDVHFEVVDITKPRDKSLLKLTHGTTELPVLITDDGKVVKESLIIMQYLEDIFSEQTIARRDPYQRAVQNMLTMLEEPFVMQGYMFLMNQVIEQREAHHEKMLQQYAKLNDFLEQHSPDGTYLFDEFGWAECIFTPFFMRFWFLEYYEGFKLPTTKQYVRVARWQLACLEHPAAQQVTKEEVIKLYYDYAKGAGNGALVEGRKCSSFVFEPDWRTRPWPPKDKYHHNTTDEELGLVVAM